MVVVCVKADGSAWPRPRVLFAKPWSVGSTRLELTGLTRLEGVFSPDSAGSKSPSSSTRPVVIRRTLHSPETLRMPTGIATRLPISHSG